MHKKTPGLKLISALLTAVLLFQPFSAAPVIDLFVGRSMGVVHAADPQQGGNDDTVYLPLISSSPGPPAFVINSPVAGTAIGGITFFSIQPTGVNPIERVTFQAGAADLGADADGSDGFRVYVNAADLPAGPIQLTATASGPGGETTQTIAVTVVPNPPQSATIGPEGGVLASEIGSVISILPGTVPAGTTVTIDELTLEETTARHGIEWESMGVTFLGAQDVIASAPVEGPFGMVASAGFGSRVQPGQAVVNYRIVPDADGDGVDEIVVINTASVAPNNDVVADPIDSVQVRSATAPLGNTFNRHASQDGGLAGPPGTVIDVEIFGLNPNSARGNVAVFQPASGQAVEVSGAVLPGANGGPQTFSVVLPHLPGGPASFVVVNKSTGFTSDPISVTVLAAVPLDRPATEIIDDYFAQTIEYMESLPRLPSDQDSGMFAQIQHMQEMRSQFQELSTTYPQMEPDEAAVVQEELDALASQIVASGVLDVMATGAQALEAAGWEPLELEPAAELASCFTRGERKFLNYVTLIAGAGAGVGCTIAGVGVGIIWSGPVGAAVAAIGTAVCAAGVAVLAGATAIEIGDVPDCGQPPSCAVAPGTVAIAPGTRSGSSGANRLRSDGPIFPAQGSGVTTGMGSATPPGGDACGNGDGGGGDSLLRAQQQADLAGRFMVKIFSSGNATPFTGMTDAGGYFFVPFIPAGEPFTAVAIDLVTNATRTFTGTGPDTGDSVYMSFNFFTQDEFVPTISWDGGGDGASWQDPLNWNLDRVPDETDRVGIDVSESVTVTYDSGTTTIISLHSTETLVFAGGSLTVNAPSTVTGTLTLADDFTLIAEGQGTTFTATGPATIDGANLTAQNGGQISFPTVTGYAGSEVENSTTLLADGQGSAIDLSGVTTLKGNTRNFLLGGGAYLAVRALNGGRIDLSSVAEITQGRVQATADGAGSEVDFAALTRFAKPANGESFLEVTNGAAIVAGQLTELDAAGLKIAGTGQISTTQISAVNNALIEVDNASPDLSGIADVDGSDLTAKNGGLLSLPSVTSYAGSGGGFLTVLQAEGSGSTIDLSAVVALTGNTFVNDSLAVKALSGGTVDLSNLPAITVGKVQFTADGSGSSIDLSALTRFLRDDRGTSFLKPLNGGTILAAALTILDGVTLTLDGTGTLATSQITDFTAGVAEVIGITPDFGGMTDVDGSSFLVTDGGTVSLPQVTRYAGADGPATLRAEGSGSTLDLATVTTFDGRTFTNARVAVEATNGGTIDLSNVPEITVGKVQFTADGSGSTIDLSALTRFERDGRGISLLKPNNGGTISLNGGTTAVQGVDVQLDSGSTLAVGTLALETDSTLSGSGPLSGSLVNGGAVGPGQSAGAIDVSGTYSQTGDGLFTVEIGGTLAGTGFDQVTVNGAATITGTLDIDLIDSFVPNVGDSFVVLTAGSLAGTFGEVTGLSIDSDKTFAVNYSGTEVTLTVETVP